MELIEIKNKDNWDRFVKSFEQNRFSQSWDWGDVCEARGLEIKRLGLVDGEDIEGVAFMWGLNLFLGKKYWYCPGGPIIKKDNRDVFFDLIKKKLGGNVLFFRFEPGENVDDLNLKIEKSINIQPKETLVLDLLKSEDELLSKMHQKTRYNIRLAKKKGVEIKRAEEEDFEKWWKIMEETGGRDKFKIHDKSYYESMLSFNNENSGLNTELYLAYYKNEVVAGNIVSFFGDTATYVHGASSYEYRKLMAPYLLQWQAIKRGKEKGCEYYDFYGIDEKKWPGITRFKKGFGGKEITRPGTFDLILNKGWYNVYKILRYIRRRF